MKTSRGYLSHTIAAVYCSTGKKQLDFNNQVQVYTYIKTLERDGDLSNKTRVKLVATTNNLDLLINTAFSEAYSLTLMGIRLVLNLALYMNLFVDCCGRGSDLAWAVHSLQNSLTIASAGITATSMSTTLS
jgi:hypothetical protein